MLCEMSLALLELMFWRQLQTLIAWIDSYDGLYGRFLALRFAPIYNNAV